MKNWKRAARAPLIVACFVSGLMIMVLAICGPRSDLKASDWASWVQAVGSISAILISLGLTSYQVQTQRHAENLRAARDDLRIALFAEAVIHEAIESVRAVETAQHRWPDGVPYVFHECARVNSAHLLVQTLVREPMFSELIDPAMKTHALLVAVLAAGEQLVGQGTFKANSRFALVWTQQNDLISNIKAQLASAMDVPRRAVELLEQDVYHS